MNRQMEIGYGGGAIADYPWNLDGTKLWTASETEKAVEILKQVPKLGIRFVDTANRYGNGLSEEIIGDVLENNVSVNLITKIGLDDVLRMRSDYFLSLSRLGRISGLLIHNPDFARRQDLIKACEWMRTLMGDVAWIGFSTEPTKDAAWYYNEFCLNAIEFPYSVSDMRAQDCLFPWLRGQLTIANRILGGPKKDRMLTEGEVMDALNFIERSGMVDVGLIGTMNLDHLKSAVISLGRIRREQAGRMESDGSK